MSFTLSAPYIKVKHKHVQKITSIVHVLEKDHGIRKGDLFITNKPIRVNEIETAPTEDNIINISDIKFSVSLEYFIKTIPSKSCLLFLGVVFIPTEGVHYLRFLHGNKFLLFSFIKGVTFRNLRKNFTIINNDQL